MQTTREIQESIDDLAIEGQAIYDAAKAANRELTSEESDRFDAITGQLVPDLRKKLGEAQAREDKIRSLAQTRQREQRAAELSGMNSESLQRNAVLPINGREQTENNSRDGRAFVKVTKLRAFKSDTDAYDSGMWMRAMIGREFNREDVAALQHCQRRGLSLTNAGTEGQGSTGGYLVPAPLSQTLIDVRESVGVARRLLQVVPMTADTLEIPKRAGGLTVYGAGESAAFTASDKSWSQVKLVADKRYVAHQISQELTDDAIINIVDDAVSEMGYALALAEDSEAINGDGTSTYRGVLGIKNGIGAGGVYTAATNMDTWGELAMLDFTGTMGKLPSQYWTGEQLSWVCSASFYHAVMLRVLAEAGGNTIANLQSGDTGMPMFLGHPVYFTDRMPTATAAATIHAYFGNWRQLGILGQRTDVRVARSDDYAFLNDLTTIKATSRYDIKLHAPGTASAAGAVVALKTAS